MHYFQFNIGDYASHTRNLSLMEDLAFRRLLDEYYLHEHPLNECVTTVARSIGMIEFKSEIEYVLNTFFDLTDSGWVNERAEREISAYQAKREQASKAGKASAAKRMLNERSTDVEDNPTDVQPNINHKTINNKDSQRLFSDDDLEIANTIYSKILTIDSKAKKPNFNKWADDIRLMRERDNRTPEEIKSVFEFANKDAFWKSNILSPAKLRAKFTTLLAQKQRSGNKEGSKPFDPYENYL